MPNFVKPESNDLFAIQFKLGRVRIWFAKCATQRLAAIGRERDSRVSEDNQAKTATLRWSPKAALRQAIWW